MDIPALKKRIYSVLDLADAGHWPSRVYDVFIISLILANVATVTSYLLGAHYVEVYKQELSVFWMVSMVWFATEYALKMWACDVKGYTGWRGRLRYALSPIMLVDLVVLIPWVVPFLVPQSLLALKVFDLARLAKLTKGGKLAKGGKYLKFGKLHKTRVYTENLVETGLPTEET